MSIRVAPSLLSADFASLAEEIRDVESGGADLLHLDLMDGRFVPNLTFGPPIVARLAPHTTIPLDAHLMVADPDSLIPDLARAGVSRISVHVEACTHLHRTLHGIRDLGVSPGVALNPGTPLVSVEEALSWVDFVLVMSVNPGFGGQDFIAESLDKVLRLRKMCGDRRLDIEVDGGVAPGTARQLAAAGATTLVAGSAIFGHSDRARAIHEIRAAAEEGAGG
jgi:ribulose-phosphate 3-epimerase